MKGLTHHRHKVFLMRLSGQILVFFACLSLLFLAACGEDGESIDTPDAVDGADAADTTDASGAADAAGTTDACDELVASSKSLDYRFVRITDVSGDGGASEVGANIDSVFFTKASSGCSVFPSSIPDYAPAGGDLQATDPNAILANDAFPAFPDTSTCALEDASGNPTFVSLGGSGYLIAQFSVFDIEPGDILSVLQVDDGCEGGSSLPRDIAVFVEIGVSSDPQGTWHPVGYATGADSITITSAMIPPVEAAP